MKKITVTLALALGLGILFSNNVQAIDPVQSAEFTGLSYEKEIKIQDWMIDVEAFTSTPKANKESSMELQAWMLDAPWGNDLVAEEDNIQVEDWMLEKFSVENPTLALEDWMLRISI
jgi:hypothetical protein